MPVPGRGADDRPLHPDDPALRARSRCRPDPPISGVEAAIRAARREAATVNAMGYPTIPSLMEQLRKVMAELREIGRHVPG